MRAWRPCSTSWQYYSRCVCVYLLGNVAASVYLLAQESKRWHISRVGQNYMSVYSIQCSMVYVQYGVQYTVQYGICIQCSMVSLTGIPSDVRSYAAYIPFWPTLHTSIHWAQWVPLLLAWDEVCNASAWQGVLQQSVYSTVTR